MKSRFQRGVSALATVLTALSVFAILTASVGQLAVERLRGTSRSNIQVRAKYATTYGVERVCQYLESHVAYDNANNSLSISPVDYADFQAQHTLVPLSQDQESRFTARLFSNLNGTASITAPDGVVIAPGQIYIQMLGQVGEQIAKVSSRHSGTMAHIGIQEFPYAVLTDGPITVSNSTINGFASSLSSAPGPFNATYAANSQPPGVFNGIARLASNARLNSIVLNNSNVDGSLHFGPGGDPAAALNITGSNPSAGTALAQPIFLTKYKPPVSPSAATAVDTVSGAGNSLVINAGTYYSSVNVSNGATLTLRATQPGTNNFYFSESLLLTDATLKLELASPAENCRIKVYVGDRLIARNSTINGYERNNMPASPDATQGWSYSLQLFGVGRGGPLGHSEMEFTNTTCCALIAGSKTNVKVLDGSHLYGAVKAKTFELTNSSFSYDAAVTLANVRRTLWGLVSWTLQGVSDYQGESLFIELGGGAAAAAAVGPAALGPATAASLGASGDAVTAAAGGAAGDAAAIFAATTNADAAAGAAAAVAATTPPPAGAAGAAATPGAGAVAMAADAAAATATTADAAAAAATAVTDAVATSTAATTADAAAVGDAAAAAASAATASAAAAAGTSPGSTTVGNAGYDAFYYGCPGPNSHCP